MAPSSKSASREAPARGSSAKKRSKPRPASRAVLRDVEPGSTVECVHCGDRVKFQAKMRHKQVICNVYVGKRWDRVEHFHAPCYEEAGEPHGEVDTTPPVRRPRQAAAATGKQSAGAR